jgi:PemK-like protein.
MVNLNRGDVYTVLYPFDDEEIEKLRPGIILDSQNGRAIVIKVTSHEEREYDDGDYKIIHWEKAGLDRPSVARCNQFVPLDYDKIAKF